MATYTNEYSRLPNQIMELHHYKDVDNSVAPLINQIKILQEQGKYDRVNAIIDENPDLNLKQYTFGAENWNALCEENRNNQILAKSKKQCIYYQNEEPEGGNSNVWIK